ncbi:MAG: DUF4157 domain-containing protein [Bacteroidia bacterium]|nr:MAG: DUF4157 domain-containing protein [Bacteroidia bacterium]
MYERISISDKRPKVKSQNRLPQIRRKKNHSKSMNSPVDRILFLQRTAGNQAVQRMIKSGALQAKLRIGQPGDTYEQEADRVAEQVMRMPEPLAVFGGTPYIQRVCPGCEDEELKRQPIEEEELQAKATSDSISEVNPDIESHIQNMRGGGQPLPEFTRAFFEPRFGSDFSQVRVHSDAKAAESAREVNAKAYTVGTDIMFGAGQYAPVNSTGQKLIAHELTHVVQQQPGSVGMEVVRRLSDPDCKPCPLTLRGSSGSFIHTFYTPSFRGAGATIDIDVSVDYHEPPPPYITLKSHDFRVSVWQCHLFTDEKVTYKLSDGLPDTVSLRGVRLPAVSLTANDAFYVKVYSRSPLEIKVTSYRIALSAGKSHK